MTSYCVLFDMDGTLYDSSIDFRAIRRQLDLPQDGRPILEQLKTASPEIRDRGIEWLHAAEADAAAHGKLITGTTQLIGWLREERILCGLVTNNSRRSADVILAKHPLLSLDVVVTRDDAVAKPEPDLFLLAMRQLGVQPSSTAAVGDTHLDALAANRAGIREIHLISLPIWMEDVIPSGIEYKSFSNLVGVRMGLEAWLRREIEMA